MFICLTDFPLLLATGELGDWDEADSCPPPVRHSSLYSSTVNHSPGDFSPGGLNLQPVPCCFWAEEVACPSRTTLTPLELIFFSDTIHPHVHKLFMEQHCFSSIVRIKQLYIYIYIYGYSVGPNFNPQYCFYFSNSVCCSVLLYSALYSVNFLHGMFSQDNNDKNVLSCSTL